MESAIRYARALLGTAAPGASLTPVLEAAAAGPRDPLADWARYGGMYLTGYAGEAPLPAPCALTEIARGALAALAALGTDVGGLDAPRLLFERAAAFGWGRRGAISAGGSCRLLRAADDWIAVHLARDDDVASAPAWLELDAVVPADPWPVVEAAVRARRAGELVERARLLGLPVALAAAPPSTPAPWLRRAARGEPKQRASSARPLVVDLSALWAGPLAAQLLVRAGARVIKVESVRRPDGARRGPSQLYALLNEGKRSVALDFESRAGRAVLRALCEQADLVIESARPRALAQLGIDARELVRSRPGLSWIGITGYGREGPEADRVAFGDDAGVAAGLARATAPSGAPPLFCGDAIADPLTGLHAAVAALGSFRSGGGELLDVSLVGVTAHALGTWRPSAARAATRRRGADWDVQVDGGSWVSVERPRLRPSGASPRPLGADTRAVLAELGIAC